MRKSDSFAEMSFLNSDSKKYISTTKFACSGLIADEKWWVSFYDTKKKDLVSE